MATPNLLLKRTRHSQNCDKAIPLIINQSSINHQSMDVTLAVEQYIDCEQELIVRRVGLDGCNSVIGAME